MLDGIEIAMVVASLISSVGFLWIDGGYSQSCGYERKRAGYISCRRSHAGSIAYCSSTLSTIIDRTWTQQKI